VAPPVLTSLDEDEWLASHPGHLNPEVIVPCSYSTGGWVGPEPVWAL
jgi:hypothetical protein